MGGTERKKRPAVKRDSRPFTRVVPPDENIPAKDRKYLDLADIALGGKTPDSPRRKRRQTEHQT